MGDVVTEAPVLQFDDYALAFHFAVEWNDDRLPAVADAGDSASGETVREPMESYERDLLLYAHRDEPPFRTRLVRPGLKTVTAHFPAELVCESEDRVIQLQCAEADETGRRRKFTVFTSETIFERSRTMVLNLVLAPREDAPGESQLNEYDVIKLIKLWEGGERQPAQGWGEEIRFETTDGKSETIEQIAGRVFERSLYAKTDRERPLLARLRGARPDPMPPTPPLAYRVGTVELQIPTRRRDQLFRDIAVLKEGGDPPDRKRQPARWARVVAVGGVLQGLLDFHAINSDELADVFADVDIDADDKSLVGFHKGTLLSLSAATEPEPDEVERPSPIGVDPYLALPNVVLLHNEQRLKAARQRERLLSLGQPRRSRSPSDRVDIDRTADGLDKMTGLLAQHLPNIFHYRAERQLYETGEHSRGFDDLEKLLRLRREELMSTLQSRQRSRDKWTAVLAVVSAVVVGVVAAVQNLLVKQAIQTVDWWVILILAGFLYLAFFRLRKRLF